MFRKFFLLITLTCFCIGVIILIVTTKERIRELDEALVRENELLIKIAASSIETGYVMGFLPLKTLKEISEAESILFLWMVKPTGEIYLAGDPEMWGKVITNPFLGTEEKKVGEIIYPRDGQKIKLIAHPIKREIGEKPWTLFLGVSLEQIALVKRKIIFTSLSFFIGMMILAVFISIYLVKGITKPLELLREGAEIIGKGNLECRIKIKTGDEIEELANAFNQMRENLRRYQASLEESKTVLEIRVKARTKELKELAEGLEEEVKRRTKEIHERMKELERFHRLAVGRELKMIELKKEIKKLKEDLKI